MAAVVAAVVGAVDDEEAAADAAVLVIGIQLEVSTLIRSKLWGGGVTMTWPASSRASSSAVEPEKPASSPPRSAAVTGLNEVEGIDEEDEEEKEEGIEEGSARKGERRDTL